MRTNAAASAFGGVAVQSAAATTADHVVASLRAHGVDTVFGLPGLHNDPFFDACARSSGVRVIHPRHEQACGYMALGAALATGRPQVAAVVPGPGLLNASAAILTAEGMCAEVLTIAGQIPQADIDRNHGHLHEIRDQIGLAAHIAKFARRIRGPAEAKVVTAQAFAAMAADRPGPAVVECAMDTWARRGPAVAAAPLEKPAPVIDEEAVAKAARLLADARRPLIVVGGGALDASREVRRLAELLQAPVLSYRRGRGVVPSDHPLAINLPIGHRLWPEVDVVAAIGTRFLIQEKQWGLDDGMKVVRIDADPEAADRQRPPAASLVGDAAPQVAALVERLERDLRRRPETLDLAPHRAWFAERLSRLQPQADFLMAIREALPADGIFVDEVTQVGFVSRLSLPIQEPRTFLSPGYQDNLGWGYGTALGVQAACPDRAVVAIAGDGGFLYQVGELATAALHRLPVVAVVFDNGMYGNVKRIQQERFGGRLIACDLRSPDFPCLAESFGVAAYRAATPRDLGRVLSDALSARVPGLVHVRCGEMPNPWDMILMPRNRG